MKNKIPEELPIMKKAYEMALYITPMVEKMPRSHRFTLGDRIVSRVYEFMEVLTMARYSSPKINFLNQGNMLLERLRLLLRLAKDLNMSEVFWMNMQLCWNLYRAKQSEEGELRMIKPHISTEYSVNI